MYASPTLDLEFEVNIKIDQVIFDPDLAIPLGLIINEIACNSMKHAFEKNGVFYIKLIQEKNGGYKLIAGDNGKGINAEKSEDSLGMSLIEILCEQIEAKLEIKNSESGLEYIIQF